MTNLASCKDSGRSDNTDEYNKRQHMKILHLRSSGGFYGAENVIVQLAVRQQSPSLYALVGCIETPDQKGELFERCLAKGIEAESLPCQGMINWNVVMKIRRRIKHSKIDILCSHDYKSTFLGLLASYGLNLRRVAVNHLWDDIDFKLWVYERAEGVLYNLLDHVVAVSDEVAQDVRPYLLNKKKLTVISNGIDTEAYKNYMAPRILRHALGIGNEDILIGVVGRLVPQKGHIYLIEAAKKLVMKYDNLKFVFWGHGYLEEELRREVNNSALSEFVIFAGVAQNMPEVYREIDLLVMPSLSEGLPMTLLEAMSAGVLVLATTVGGIPKAIRNGENGFLVPPRDADRLAQVIEKLVAMEPNQKAEVTLRGQHFIEENFSADVMAEKYARLFAHIMNPLKESV